MTQTIVDFMYNMDINDNGNIQAVVQINSETGRFEITEKDLKRMLNVIKVDLYTIEQMRDYAEQRERPMLECLTAARGRIDQLEAACMDMSEQKERADRAVKDNDNLSNENSRLKTSLLSKQTLLRDTDASREEWKEKFWSVCHIANDAREKLEDCKDQLSISAEREKHHLELATEEADKVKRLREESTEAVESLYQIIQRGDLTSLDLEQAEEVFNRFSKSLKEVTNGEI